MDTMANGIQLKDPLVNLTLGSDEIIDPILHFHERSSRIIDPAVGSMIMSAVYFCVSHCLYTQSWGAWSDDPVKSNFLQQHASKRGTFRRFSLDGLFVKPQHIFPARVMK